MGDDLDDLLDEIESKMSKKPRNKSPSEHGDDNRDNATPTSAKPKAGGKGRRRQDLNDALDDIFDDGPQLDLTDELSHSLRIHSGNSDSNPSSTTKCFPLLIGGSSESIGLSTTVSKQCCSSLRCYNCDFSVVMFDNFRWSPDIDYLFLRNNMPDFNKLQSRLLSRRNSRAYACQCQWINAQEITELTGELKRLWHCGGKH